MSLEDVVPQDQADRIGSDKIPAENKGLGQPFGPGLRFIGKGESELGPVAEQVFEFRQVIWGGDDQYLTNAGQHQHG